MSDEGLKKKKFENSVKEVLLFIPNLLKLLYRLVQDERVPGTDKALLLAAIAYVLSPWDFLPDIVPVMGQLDDVLLVALVIKRLMDSVDQEILFSYWDGNGDLLELIQDITDIAVRLLPPGIYRKLVKKADYRHKPADKGFTDVDFEVK